MRAAMRMWHSIDDIDAYTALKDKLDRTEERLQRSLTALVQLKATVIPLQQSKKALFAEWELELREEVATALVKEIGDKIDREHHLWMQKIQRATARAEAYKAKNAKLEFQLKQSQHTNWLLQQKCCFLQDALDNYGDKCDSTLSTNEKI